MKVKRVSALVFILACNYFVFLNAKWHIWHF